MLDKIKKDLILAQKEKKETEVSTLRMLLTSLLNKEKDKRFEILKNDPQTPEESLKEKVKLTSEEIIEVISSEAKKRKDAISSYNHGGREELAEKENSELEILKKYLPKQMEEEEIRILVKKSVENIGAQTIKDMGAVMKDIMPKTKGKADGSLVSRIVKEILS